MLQINVNTNLRQFEKSISATTHNEIPFATAKALTALARTAATAEKTNEAKVLYRPKPFTQNALGVIPANKRRLSATMYLKDITARYLEPYEFGGTNVLNSRALLIPIAAARDLDEYGNLPRNYLKRLKQRSDIYIGAVKTKAGTVNGVWQRSVAEGSKVGVTRRGRDGSLRAGSTRKGNNTSGRLTLLIRFGDAHKVRQRLGWFDVARRIVDRDAEREMKVAISPAFRPLNP